MSWLGKSYHKKSDEDLMLLLQSKDQKAFSELYDRYSERLLNYFFSMLWKDREKAEDFMQDLFAKLIQKPELFDGSRSFKTWVFSIANNMCKNEYRHHEVKTRAGDHFNTHGARSENMTVEKDMDRAQFDEELQQVLGELDNDKRTTFCMRYFDELSIKEIAAV
ncbi:MAG: sigma-70 family RNA polymerase sigma factor, partial [Flavobacteriales bacterium]|nr:sigma-70 family RNA polymerase sigma factor [Flavobacteriales bacterium]